MTMLHPITALEDDGCSTWSDGDAIVILVDDQQMDELNEGYEPADLETAWYGYSALFMMEYLKDNNLLDDFVKKYPTYTHTP